MTIPDLFQKLPAIHDALPGWCDENKATTLASIIVAFRPAVIVEIGIFGGKSFIPMALALKTVNPAGVCIGIDPWSREVAVREQTRAEDRDWWAAVDLNKFHDDFMAKLRELDLMSVCRIERRESRQVEPPNGISVLHLDGSHSDTALQDVVRYAPKVIVGGYCVTDDSEWHGGGVTRAERRLLEMGFAKIAPLGTGCIFQRLR